MKPPSEINSNVFSSGIIFQDINGNININGTPYQNDDQLINVSSLLREIEAAGEPNQVCMDKVYAGAIVLLRLMRESGLPKMDLISKLVNDL